MMGFPVASHIAGSVHSKNNRQILHAHVDQNLIVCSLQESRIQGNHRSAASKGKPGRKIYGMFFRNSYVKTAIGKTSLKFIQAGSLYHRSTDSYHPGILRSDGNQFFSEYFRKAKLSVLFFQGTGFRIKGADSVKFLRRFFRTEISFSLFVTQ